MQKHADGVPNVGDQRSVLLFFRFFDTGGSVALELKYLLHVLVPGLRICDGDVQHRVLTPLSLVILLQIEAALAQLELGQVFELEIQLPADRDIEVARYGKFLRSDEGLQIRHAQIGHRPTSWLAWYRWAHVSICVAEALRSGSAANASYCCRLDSNRGFRLGCDVATWFRFLSSALAASGLLLLSGCGLFGVRSAPSELLYVPDTHSTLVGIASATYQPSIDGGNSGEITFSILSASVAGIEIEVSSGVVSIDEDAPVGEYSIDVSAANSIGTTPFIDAITVSVLSEAIPPVAVVYADSDISLSVGDEYNGEPPFVDHGGALIVSFLLGSGIVGISIAPTTGVISVAASTPEGDYSLDIQAENEAGTTLFVGAVTISVRIPPPVTFVSDIRPVIQGSCAPCHTGGSQPNLTVYANAKQRIGNILGRITLSEGSADFMPRGRSKLSASRIELFEEWQSDGLLEN